MYKYLLATMFLLSGCTIAITQTQTEGVASDVVDETQTNTPDVSPTLSVPLKAL